MNKKVISAVLAGVMSLSTLGTSVFAASNEKALSAAGQTTFKISAAVAAPVIDVTVPSSISAAINPYGVEITVKGGTLGAGGVSSANYVIVNKTLTSAIKVKATPTLTVPTTKDKDGKPQNSWVVEEDSSKAGDVKKETETKTMYAEVMGYALATAVAEDNKGATDLPDYTQSDWDTAGAAVKHLPFLDATVNATRDKEAAAKVGNTEELLVLPKAEKEITADDKAKDPSLTVGPAKNGYGVIAISGAISDTDDWTTKDKVSLNLVLDIGPCADPTP